MNKFEYKNLTPFKWFVLENFPFIEADFDAITNYQLFCKLGEETNKIINSTNTLGIQVESLTDFVSNYFDNLDVQEEVNNKLNEMAQSGQLADLISQYLESQAIIGFNNTTTLGNATNLANGSIARTLGRNQYNDGYGAFYKIRQRTNQDIPDGYNLITLVNTENLVAERIIDLIQQQNTNDLIKLKPLSKVQNRKFLFVGDSYAVGYQGAGQDNIEGYFDKVKNRYNLNAQIIAENGYGFLGINNNLKWINLIQNANIQNKDSFTDIIICGGMNDRGADDVFENAINELLEYLETNFINAIIHVGCVGHYKKSSDQNLVNMRKVAKIYKTFTIRKGHKYIDNSELILHRGNWFINDNIHPNETGEKQLAYGIEQYLINNKITSFLDISNSDDFMSDTILPAEGINTNHIGQYSRINENNVTISFSGAIQFNNAININNLTDIIIGEISDSYLTGSANNQGLSEYIIGYVYSTNSVNNSPFVKVGFRIYNDSNNNLHLTSFTVLDEGNLLNNLNITEIAFPYGAITLQVDTHYC